MQEQILDILEQDGDELDILVQKRRDKKAASRFLKKILKGQQVKPLKIVTDKLKSYSATKREVMISVEHTTQHHTKQSLRLWGRPCLKYDKRAKIVIYFRPLLIS